MSAIGVPIKVLHESEGHVITVETLIGDVYRGILLEAEDNMNCQIGSVAVTYRNGQAAQLENIFIRGSKIRFMILPDMLKNAPMFTKMTTSLKNSGVGSGKSAILKAQGAFYIWSNFQKYFFTVSMTEKFKSLLH